MKELLATNPSIRYTADNDAVNRSVIDYHKTHGRIPSKRVLRKMQKNAHEMAVSSDSDVASDGSFDSTKSRYKPKKPQRTVIGPTIKRTAKVSTLTNLYDSQMQSWMDQRKVLSDKWMRLHPISDREKRAQFNKQIAAIDTKIKQFQRAHKNKYKVITNRDMAGEIDKFL